MESTSPTSELKSKILGAINMETLIGESVSLQRRGNRATGLCPFHEEKSPSFYVFDDHYHCFGCGAHGDGISFVQNEQGLGFIDALKWLGRKYDLDITALDRSDRKIGEWKKRTRLTKMILEAQRYFSEQLMSNSGAEARNYLISRGISEEMWQRFGIGYALDRPRALGEHLLRKGADLKELEEISLVQQYKDNYFDFYRHRIMLPIKDTSGRTVAFGGRALGAQAVKYKNSRFEKGEILFGMDLARKAMRSAGFGVVVEGYFDVISLHEVGLDQVVAAQGTALSMSHLRAIASATDKLILLFDGDLAGARAALKVVENSLEVGNLSISVACLPVGEDPDSYIRRYGLESLKQLFEEPRDLLEFAISESLKGATGGELIQKVERQIIPWLAKIRDPLRKSFLIHKVAEFSAVDIGVIRGALSGLSTASPSKVVKKTSSVEVVSQDTLVDGATPYLQLRRVVREWLGYLYFIDAKSCSLNVDQRKQFFDRVLALDPVWSCFVSEMFDFIRLGKRPCEVPVGGWVSLESDSILNFIESLALNKGAYVMSAAVTALEKIESSLEVDHLETQRKSLQELLISGSSMRSKEETQRYQQEFLKVCRKMNELRVMS